MEYELDGGLYPFDSGGLATGEMTTLQWAEVPHKITYISAISRDRTEFIFDHAAVSNGDIVAWYWKNLDNRRLRIMIMND